MMIVEIVLVISDKIRVSPSGKGSIRKAQTEIFLCSYSILHPQYGQYSSPFIGATLNDLPQNGQRFLIAIMIKSIISNTTPIFANVIQSAIHEIKITIPKKIPTILQIVLNNLNELIIMLLNVYHSMTIL